MADEIEAKMKVSDLAQVRARLKSAGAKPAGEHFETNVFFDREDAGLVRADKGLRLRTDHHVETGITDFILTFKGPRQSGTVKRRQEIEFSVNDAAAATAVFEALGFKVALSFQKRRESWKLADCKIELDQVPHLGTYVEIEGPSEEIVLKTRQTLGLEQEPLISTSYASLLAKYLEEHQIASRRVEFDR